MTSKFVFPLILGLISAFSLTSNVNSSNAQNNEVVANSPTYHSLRAQASDERDYSSEVKADSELMISVGSSTLTSVGQSFTFSFSTGGQGYWDSTETYLLAPDDEEFESYYNDYFSNLTVEEREAITAEYEEGTYEPRHFNSSVFQIYGKESLHDIVIPRSLTRNHIFNLDVLKMGVNVVPDWTNITSITIPEDVADLSVDTFQNVPAGMIFNVEHADRPEGWAEGWNHGAKVNYGYVYPESKAEPLSKAGAKQYGNEEANYIIGWYPKEGDKAPLVLEYKVKREDGSLSDSLFFDFSPDTENTLYECVGYQIYDFSRPLFCDIETNEGETIDFSSLVLHNIYKAEVNSSGVAIPKPDFSQAYYAKPSQAFSRVWDINDFLNLEFSGLSSFSGYTALDLNISVPEENIYKALKSNYYEQHLAEIESGAMAIRYRITSLTLGKFRIVYEKNGMDATHTMEIKTPIIQYKISKSSNNRVSFLLKDSDIDSKFSASKLRSVTFLDFYVTIDIMGDKAPVARSAATTRFGLVSLMSYTKDASVFDINLMLVLLLIGYVLAYSLCSAGLYFYRKNKYKNDEFRRMKTKVYVIRAILGLLGSLIVLFAITFIVIRATSFKNAIVVYNPVDAYIIVLSVLSVIIIGYFIKYLVGVIKAEKERRRIIRLKLDEDVDDDGTN